MLISQVYIYILHGNNIYGSSHLKNLLQIILFRHKKMIWEKKS